MEDVDREEGRGDQPDALVEQTTAEQIDDPDFQLEAVVPGIVQAKGLINNREQLDSLFNALDAGVASFQQLKSIREAG